MNGITICVIIEDSRFALHITLFKQSAVRFSFESIAPTWLNKVFKPFTNSSLAYYLTTRVSNTRVICNPHFFPWDLQITIYGEFIGSGYNKGYPGWV